MIGANRIKYLRIRFASDNFFTNEAVSFGVLKHILKDRLHASIAWKSATLSGGRICILIGDNPFSSLLQIE